MPRRKLPPKEPEPPTEPVEAPQAVPPQPTGGEWWKEIPPGATTAAPTPPANPTADARSIAELVSGALAIVHEKAAELTEYPGWTLTPAEREWWTQAAAYMLKDADLKNAGIYVVVMMLVVSEGGKIAGYMSWRKKTGRASLRLPRRAPKAPAAPAEEAPKDDS